MKKESSQPSSPSINSRFVYFAKRYNKNLKKFEFIPQLNADGHIDYAHQFDLGDIKTEIIDTDTYTDVDGGRVRWVTVKATVIIDGRTVTGMSTECSRNVQQIGFETSIAETRALKRAIAFACNITEKIINPEGETPTREIVDMPLDNPLDEEENKIPTEKTKPAMDVINSSDEQFDV